MRGAGRADTHYVHDPPAFADVLAAARSAAPWACREIWVRHSASVAGFLAARGASEPEDLTSEVFLTVFSTLDRFCGDERGFRALIFTIAHRRLVDDLRRRARRPLDREWTQETDHRRAPSAEDQAFNELGSDWVRDLLDQLSPDQRDVLLLRIFGDLTVEQVATLLGKREGAVKALQRRALAALRKKLAASEYPYPAGERFLQTT